MDTRICDFARSFLAFTIPDVNTARIQIDARCSVSTDGDDARDYVLITPCRGENTHGKDHLILDPNYEFSGVFEHRDDGGGDHVLTRTFAQHEAGRWVEWEDGRNADRFGDVAVTIAEYADARRLETSADIVDAVRANRPIVARTKIHDDKGRTAELEYPMKTINVVGADTWQVDTGPLIVPSWIRDGSDPVPRGEGTASAFDAAFIVYNTFDWAEFVLREPTPVGDALVWHYSRIVVMDAESEFYAA